MDNFMDKLSKRFNAGEIIQANGEAEAREVQRMKQQIGEYEKMMQEVRRLNLKTAEMSEQVSQMLASGIEQFEAYSQDMSHIDQREQQRGQEYEKAVQAMEAVEKSVEDFSLRMQGSMQKSETDIKREISDAAYRVEASISELRQVVLQGQNKDSVGDEFAQKTVETLEKMLKAQEESSKQLKEMIVNLRLYMDEVQKHIEDYVHKENVKVYRNVQANFAEQMTNRFRDVGDQLGSLDRDVSKNRGTKALLVITFLVAATSVALQVVQILGIL